MPGKLLDVEHQLQVVWIRDPKERSSRARRTGLTGEIRGLGEKGREKESGRSYDRYGEGPTEPTVVETWTIRRGLVLKTSWKIFYFESTSTQGRSCPSGVASNDQ